MSTIVAISTAPGIGGIGIVRLSGEKTFEIISKIFIPKNKTNNKIEGYTLKYGHIVDEDKLIDEVLVSYFVSPKSYTTEDMCEINSHGGMIVLKKIVELCVKNGAKIAEAGEFTKRAFLNGRIDLTQAEAVINVIEAKGEKELKTAINQLEGELKYELNEIKNNVLGVLTNIEANIDYPEYDVEELTKEMTIDKMHNVQKKLEKLYTSFEKGKVIKEGINIAIVGKPNAGKSSLLNALLRENRAIVTEYEGTTRDTIEEFVNINGIPTKLIDTAGIRETDNEVEKIGINRSKEIIAKSDMIFALLDSSQEITEEDQEILDLIKAKKALIILNKIDIEKNSKPDVKYLNKYNKKIIYISAKTRDGIDQIHEEVTNMFNLNEINVGNEAILTNVRHKKLIEEALTNTKKAIETINKGLPIDIVAINLREILEAIGKITGESVSEEIIKDIFSKFCLGK